MAVGRHPSGHSASIPNQDSTLAALVYWARYKSFWFRAVSRILAINGAVGAALWAADQLTGAHNRTLLLIRGNLPLTLFVAALIALGFAVFRLAWQLDPEEPFANPAALVLVLGIVVAVTALAGPPYVALAEAGLLALMLIAIQLRRWKIDTVRLLKAALIVGAAVLVAGLARGVATGEVLQTRVSIAQQDGLLRLLIFLLGMSVYFLEERRHWHRLPPTPVVVERLHRACRQNDFGAISRWLGPGLTFSQADQRLMAEVILPRRLIVDGDVAVVATPGGDLLYVRAKRGQVTELRVYLDTKRAAFPGAGLPRVDFGEDEQAAREAHG